jgi:uncharacterized protein (DUF983 family)
MRRRGRLAAIALQRCPRCREGRVFRSLLAMHETCPACGLKFEREPGYFVGAMYLSYALAVPVMALFGWLVSRLRPEWPIEGSAGAGIAISLPLVPWFFRYSRVLWMHLDRSIDRAA